MVIGDDNPLKRIARPWVSWGLMAVMIAVFACELADPTVIDRFLFDPAALRQAPFAPATLTSLLSHALLHAGWLHLGGNLLMLFVFGDNIEDAFGHARFLVVCALSAISGALLQALSGTPALVGASGGIAGLMGAYLLIFPRAKFYVLAFGRLPVLVPASWFVGFWIASNLAAAAIDPRSDAGVAWFAHIGGFAMGMLLAVVARPADVALFQPAAPAAAEGWSWFRRIAYDFTPTAAVAGVAATPDEKPAAFGKAVVLILVLLSLALF